MLSATFEAVNQHFGEMFPTLFGGGAAKLVLTGEEILDAGLTVLAQPPGTYVVAWEHHLAAPVTGVVGGTSDALEATVPHELWPLPTYREMLFIK